MAMLDDRSFLSLHIRNSFITSDDTGMCELIIDAEEVGDKRHSGTDKRPTTWHGSRSSDGGGLSDSGLESDTELAHSFDILSDMDFASHRRRSNTAQRLEKLKRERHKQSKIKNVPWKDMDYTVDEIGEYFLKKEVSNVNKKDESLSQHKSCLSVQLDKFADIPNNPFMEYAKYDGKASIGMPTKKIDIYLTMAAGTDRAYPMQVVTLASAKVQDLIGLICWQYAQGGRQPPMQENLEAYAVHIAEDDGEVDMDFPALDSREPMSKFGFAKLALVEKHPPSSIISTDDAKIVTINMPNKGFSKIPIEDDSVLMRELLQKVLQRRKYRQVVGLDYTLEKEEEAGVAVDLDKPLSAMDTLDFCLVRENSVRDDIPIQDEPCAMSAMAESLTSHQYRSYIVSLSSRFMTNTDVQIGISGEKIEIDPVSGKGLFKQKASTHFIEDVGACTILDEKSSGKTLFRIVYRVGHDFKHHDFECQSEKAQEIVQRVQNILEMRSSPVRKDYIAHRARKKLGRRHSLRF